MRARVLLLALVPGLAAALAGCAAPPAAPPEGDVGMPGVRFVPAVLEVRVGQRVVWANDGTLAHTVTADDGSFDSGTMLPERDAFARTFTEPGAYGYHCKPHASRAANGTWEGMVGRIVVVAA